MTRDEKELYESSPRDLVLQWEDEGVQGLVAIFVKYLTPDQVRDCLDMNELSPRFLFQEPEETRECDDCGAYLENANQTDLCQDCQEDYEDVEG